MGQVNNRLERNLYKDIVHPDMYLTLAGKRAELMGIVVFDAILAVLSGSTSGDLDMYTLVSKEAFDGRHGLYSPEHDITLEVWGAGWPHLEAVYAVVDLGGVGQSGVNEGYIIVGVVVKGETPSADTKRRHCDIVAH